ncbi:MAG: hypothetical protein ACI841_005259 [Planctomycetota bacterium]|jgi:hypothetical protein
MTSSSARTPRALLPRLQLEAAAIAWLGLFSCTTPSVADRRPFGPIPARIEHPLSLGFLSLRPRRAEVLPAGKFGASVESAYQSIYEVQHDDTYRVAFDGETWHTSLRVRYGLGGGMDLEAEVGVLSGRSGFLDGFAENWHDATGFPDGGRSRDPKDLYRMRIRRGPNEFLYELEEGEPGTMDLPIVLTKQFSSAPDGSSAYAARAAIEIPTGEQSKGFGNGSLDSGFGLLGEQHLDALSWYWATDYVITGNPRGFEELGIEVEDLLHLQLGFEFPLGSRFAWLTQIEWVSPMVKGIDLEEVNREILDLGIGAAYRLRDDTHLRLSFHEDLVAATGPDFTLLFGLSWGL